MADAALVAQVTAPIPGAAPTGASVRYDDAFLALEAEVQKLENPAGGEVDWPRVAMDCRGILTGTSKDVLVAAWLARALWHAQRLSGLAAGLAVIKTLLASSWDGIHPQPPRLKPRRGALEWLSDKLAPLLDPKDGLSPQGREALEECRRLIDELIAVIGDRFAPEDHGLGALRRRLGELGGAAPAAPVAGAAPAPVSAAAAAVPAATGAAAVTTVVVQAPAGPPATRSEAMDRLNEIAEYFTRTEPHSPIGYLLQRAVAWNGRSFQEIYGELLKGKSDAQTQLWDALGLKAPGQK
jgi:type VI secretion system protein VasJ